MPNIGDAAFSQGDVMRRLRELEHQVRELTAGRRLENASVGQGGIRIHGGGGLRVHEGGGITIEDGGDLDISGGGDFNLSGSGDITLEGGGGLTIRDGGNISVLDGGDINVREGSLRILNSAGTFLANVVPVAFGAADNFNAGFGLSSVGPEDKVTDTIAVPSWADEALVMVVANASVRNPKAEVDWVQMQITIEGGAGGSILQGCELAPNWGSYQAISTSHSAVLTTLDSTINIAVQMWVDGSTSGAGWTSDPANLVAMDAVAIFRRSE